MDIIKLAELYAENETCDSGCECCPLNKNIDKIMHDYPWTLPKDLTICQCFDLINNNYVE